MALASAVLVVLQTHFKFERDKQGRWTVNLEKETDRYAVAEIGDSEAARHLTEVSEPPYRPYGPTPETAVPLAVTFRVER
jgi:hypothetical protein